MGAASVRVILSGQVIFDRLAAVCCGRIDRRSRLYTLDRHRYAFVVADEECGASTFTCYKHCHRRGM